MTSPDATGGAMMVATGAPSVARNSGPRVSTSERFWRHVEGGDYTTCWVWTSVLNEKGYPRFKVDRRFVRAYRFAYEQMVGEIPEGLEPDHTCRNRACVNPYHIEPVTRAENIRRAWAAGSYANRKHQAYKPAAA